MIDRKKFDDTFQYFDKDVILNIIDIFENELPGRLERIRQNILGKDFEALAFNSHSMKGAVGTFLDAEPFKLAKKMEELAIRKDDQGMTELFTKLRTASEALLKELAEIRKEFSSEESSSPDSE